MGLDQALRQSGIDLLTANGNLTVITGPVPAGTVPPYLRVYTSVEWPAADPDNALDGLSRKAVVRWTLHCIGANDLAAVVVAEQARLSLLDVRPTVAGLIPAQVGPIDHEQDMPPTVDETTGVPVVDAMHVYRMEANT